MKKVELHGLSQDLYLGRWVDKSNFRVFIYNSTGKKLVNSYEEYKNAIDSGDWFSTIQEVETKKRKYSKKSVPDEEQKVMDMHPINESEGRDLDDGASG